MVIGEPQRAFYGNQYSLTMPVFTHYGVELWVPEVGGPIDPDSEAHDLIMSVFGGMSKGERNRIKLRVRAAMAAQAAVEGRFLGGRPPYGYRIADAGPHPNPAKAADGKRLHKLEPDPETAWVVRRIFAEYLAGRGLFAIAEGLTRDRVPSPSQHDAVRNPHRTGEGWAKSAVRAILANPRYTGRQVWNKQRKDEILLDVNDVARGYETRLRWNDTEQWVWSDTIAQAPLVTVEDYEAARAIPAGASRAAMVAGRPVGRSVIPTSCVGACIAGTAAVRCKASTATMMPITGAATPANMLSPATSATQATSTCARPTYCPPSTAGSPSSSRRTGSPRPSATWKQPRPHPTARRPSRLRRTRRPSSPAATPGSPATRPPSTPEPTPRPSPDGPARSKPNALQPSPATPPRPATTLSTGSPKTTSAPSSPVSATCAMSSATPSLPIRQPSTISSGLGSPSSPDETKSGPRSPSAQRTM